MPDYLIVNPALDRRALAAQFSTSGYVQIRDVLTEESAAKLKDVLTRGTKWGLVSQVGSDTTPTALQGDVLNAIGINALARLKAEIGQNPTHSDYAFIYLNYPLVTAYLEKWQPGSAQDQLLEELNGAVFLDLLREVSGADDIVKADGQATLYAPGHFLWPHTDAESARGRAVAYVLNMTAADWRPEWGGYLTFYDLNLDIERAFRPKFNSLNLFKVPRWHSVGEVASNAPLARYAVTGWGRRNPSI